MEKKIIIPTIIILFILIIAGTTCYQNQSDDNTYISFTATSLNGECYYYTYDIASDQLTEVYKYSDYSQYPLGIVDKQTSSVYFMYRINRGDQLMKYDFQEKKLSQLTDDLYAVNQILSVEDKLYLIGSSFEHPKLSLIEYDLKTSNYEILTPISDVVRQMTYDKRNNRILFVSYNWEEQLKLKDAYEQEQTTIAKNAQHTIYGYDITTKNISELVQMDEVVTTMDIDKEGENLLLRTANSLFEPRQNIFFSLKDKKILNTLAIEQVTRLESIAFNPDNSGIYFTGLLSANSHENYPSPPNALIYMDFSTGTYENIVSFEDKYINNFVIFK